MPVLQANEIRKSFKEGRELVNVLNGVSLSLEPGEVTLHRRRTSRPQALGPTSRHSAAGDRLRLSAVQLVPRAHRPRECRIRAQHQGDARPRGALAGADGAGQSGAVGSPLVFTQGSLGWTEAADRDCASTGGQSEGFARGRAHRESRFANGDADPRFVSCAGETGEPSSADRHP